MQYNDHKEWLMMWMQQVTSRTLPVPCSCFMAEWRSTSVTWGNSSTPLWMRKHLKPATPAWIMGRSSCCKETSVVCVCFSPDSVKTGCKYVHFVSAVSLHLIARNHASPERCVHKTLSCCLLLLLTKMTKCGGWRDAISVGVLPKETTTAENLLFSQKSL